jgi:hypothetical protein
MTISDPPLWATWEMRDEWKEAVERAFQRSRLIALAGRSYQAHQYVYWSHAHQSWIISNLPIKGGRGQFKGATK